MEWSKILASRPLRRRLRLPSRPPAHLHLTRRIHTSPDAVPSTHDPETHRLSHLRNIGISAHIDSGKTTLTERVLFYTGRVREIHEVRGKDGVGAKMDSMELEREKGITIQSAATYCHWDALPPPSSSPGLEAESEEKEKFAINIIDTPGHVDFTIEVERALRVLDGAVLVLCAVSGVQSQTITVDRQMRRYNVPRISFINKMDRPGANPQRILSQLTHKLHTPAALVQIPIGSEDTFRGVVDLVRMRAIYNTGVKGIEVYEESIPEDLLEKATATRQSLISTLADLSEPLADAFLSDLPISNALLASSIRETTIKGRFTPVFVGSAIKNTGVQALLDGVVGYLPTPGDRPVSAFSTTTATASSYPAPTPPNPSTTPTPKASPKEVTKEIQLAPSASSPLVALAFKLEESKFGQLTYVRVYRGTLKRGGWVYVHSTTSQSSTSSSGGLGGAGGASGGNGIGLGRNRKKIKIPRIVRMHSSDMEDVECVEAGEICAVFGVECRSGDTFVSADPTSSVVEKEEGYLSMTSMHVPLPVVSLSIKPVGNAGEGPNFGRALNKFQKEDPTFRVRVDSGSGETIISGMGELHLSIYVERLLREYNIPCQTSRPRVAFRETITRLADFRFTHKKQTGGAGQFARVEGFIEPLEAETEEGEEESDAAAGIPEKGVFENRVMSGNVPIAYIPGVEKGFQEALLKGSLSGSPIHAVRFVLEDGAYHTVDSSELAFRMAAIGAFREAYMKSAPVVLEPVMNVEVVSPGEFQSAVIASLNARRGTILSSEIRQPEDEFTVTADVALNDMFGYAGDLRGCTQGKGEFSMEYKTHAPVLPSVQKEMEEEYRKLIGIKK